MVSLLYAVVHRIWSTVQCKDQMQWIV